VTCSGNVKCFSRDATQIVISIYEVLTAGVNNFMFAGCGQTIRAPLP